MTERTDTTSFEAVHCVGVDDGGDVEWWVVQVDGDASGSDQFETEADARAHIDSVS